MSNIPPPNNVESEEALLGAMLTDPTIILEVSQFVKAKDFYIIRNGWIYNAILECGEEADLITVSTKLASNNLLDEAGGETYLIQLLNSCLNALNFKSYAIIVKDMAIRREMLINASEAAKLAYALEIPLSESLEVISDLHSNTISSHAGINKKVKDKDATLIEILKNKTSPNGIVGYVTGIPAFDKMTRGLRKGKVSVLAGENQTGKTSLMLCEALHMMSNAGGNIPVGIISLETTDIEIEQMLASAHLGVDFSGSTLISDKSYSDADNFLQKLSDKPLHIYTSEDGNFNPSVILTRIEQWAKGGVKVVYVDNLTAISWTGESKFLRVEIGDFVANCKRLAVKYGIHIRVLCHINREGSKDKEPTKNHLAESKIIADLADQIVILYKPDDEVHGENTPDGEFVVVVGKIVKSRGGKNGKYGLRFYFSKNKHVPVVLVSKDGTK